MTADPGLPGPTGGVRVLQVHPARRCNLRCLHCYSSSGPAESAELPWAVLAAAVRDAAALGYEALSVSGGEPLLYRHLDALLDLARAHGLRTSLVTNGLLLTARRLESLAPRLDGLALSLDGIPARHAQLRGDARAFTGMARRLPALRASGLPFGLVFTLTRANAEDLGWVCAFAAREGASLVQVHPLEEVGQAARNLAGGAPALPHVAAALLDALRVRRPDGPALHLDLVGRADVLAHPEQFLAYPGDGPDRLGPWLTPLVLETDGTVSPLSYGLGRRLAVGSLHDAPLPTLATRWDPAPLLAVCRAVHEECRRGTAPELFDWYGRVTDLAAAGAGCRTVG